MSKKSAVSPHCNENARAEPQCTERNLHSSYISKIYANLWLTTVDVHAGQPGPVRWWHYPRNLSEQHASMSADAPRMQSGCAVSRVRICLQRLDYTLATVSVNVEYLWHVRRRS